MTARRRGLLWFALGQVAAVLPPAMLSGQAAPPLPPARQVQRQHVPPSAPQQSAPQLPQIRFDQTRFDTLTAKLLGDIFDNTAARGLPTEKLIGRALEGSARHASSSKILTVVRDFANALSDAREALGVQSTPAELDVGADALRAGIEMQTLANVRASRPTGSVVTPLMVLTDIVGRGVASLTAREAVLTLSRMPRSDEALLGLQSTVAKNSVRGPGMAVDALNRYVKETVSGNAPPSTSATPDRKPIRPPTP